MTRVPADRRGVLQLEGPALSPHLGQDARGPVLELLGGGHLPRGSPLRPPGPRATWPRLDVVTLGT